MLRKDDLGIIYNTLCQHIYVQPIQDISITGVDADGDPDYDCESKEP